MRDGSRVSAPDRERAPVARPGGVSEAPVQSAHTLLQLQRSAGNRVVSRLVRSHAPARAIQRNPLLDGCAQATNPGTTQIDYQAVQTWNQHQGVERADLKELAEAIGDQVDKVVKRQAVLLALDNANLTNELNAWLNQQGPHATIGALLVGSGTPIRSSHSGGVIDPLLPQGPYTAAPAGAASIRGRANWDWLRQSTTAHTTNPRARQQGQPPPAPPDPNRVASYFEITLHTTRRLGGGRVVLDPFAAPPRWFLSAHYARQYELLNVPQANAAHPAYTTITAAINWARGPARNYVANDPRWSTFFDNLVGKMSSREL